MHARPICAKCNRLVDAFSESHDPFLERVTWTAYCHGEQESVSLPESQCVGITLLSAFNEVAELPLLASPPIEDVEEGAAPGKEAVRVIGGCRRI